MTVTARSRSTDRRFYGVVEAIVVEPFGEDSENRVKVKFPWFDDTMVTEWCRVAQPYAGGGYGFVFLPEEGDEVLVAFVHGDMRLPIVIGGLYNGIDVAATTRAEDSNQKMIRTPAGNELLFDETEDEERVRITTALGHEADFDDANEVVSVTTAGGHSVVLDDGGKAVTVATSGGHTVELDDDGKKVTMASSGGHSVEMDDTGRTVVVTTSGAAKLKLDANSGDVTITGANVTVEATGIKLGGSAATQSLVLGDAFMTAFNTHTHNATALGAPTGPPIPPMQPALLSKISKTA